MTPSDETLMAYVDGELDEQARGEIEAAMLANPDIAARVARQQALRKRVHLAFEQVLDERVPDRLIAAARGMPASPGESNVIPLRRRKPTSRRWSWPEWGSIAASLAAGAVFTAIFLRHSSDEPVSSHNGHLFASGALAQALSDQLASKQAGGTRAAVQIGISFRDKQGNYCRTFALSDASALAGLACHNGDGWRVDVLARGESGSDAAAQYRPAASSMPKPILQSVEDRIAGEPLDAQGEAEAKARDWAR
jgi:anti-sigma factor RsiW